MAHIETRIELTARDLVSLLLEKKIKHQGYSILCRDSFLTIGHLLSEAIYKKERE